MKKTRKVMQEQAMQTISDPSQNGIIINVQNELTADEFTPALIKALHEHNGEVKVIVNRDGRSHFSAIQTTSILEQLTKASSQFCEEFNKQLTVDIDAKGCQKKCI